MKNDIDLLIARLDALDHELDAVQKVIESLANERAEVVALWTLSERVTDFVRSTTSRIDELRKAVDGEQSSAFREPALRLLTTIEEDVRELGGDALHTAWTNSTGSRLSVPKGDWNQTVLRFRDQANQHYSRLIGFRSTLGGKRSAPTGPDRWRKLSTLQEQHNALLKDAFSLIAGVTTVNLEVDAGVMDLARDLLSDLESMSRNGHGAIAILAEGEVFLEGARAIALRLADTTVWNVPIAAHEFGHLVAQSPAVRRFLDQGTAPSGGLPERHRHELLADVFATAALGPGVRSDLNHAAAGSRDRLRILSKPSECDIPRTRHDESSG